MADDDRLKTLTSFLAQQGFVWGPEPEIYGGVAGFYTYGPNGTRLKRNVEEKIRQVFARNQIFEVETPTILPAAVWEASGHLGGFTDPLIRDVKGNVWRADKLIEEHYADNGIEKPIPQDPEGMLAIITEESILPPSGEKLVMEIEPHNLMMQTTIGTDQEAYNRPETATATYLPFLRYAEFFRKKLPFGVFQIGKAYRNEISPRNLLLRLREFTQAEAQIFMDDATKDHHPAWNIIHEDVLPLFSWNAQVAETGVERITVAKGREEYFGSQSYAYGLHLAYTLFRSFGIPDERIRLRQHGPDEKAFYAADAWDVEINLPSLGWTECCGVHDRTTYDLDQHSKHSGEELTMFVEERREHITPHVLEIAFGVDRPVFALLDIYYDEREAEEGKTTLKLPYRLAPVEVTVLPLVKKLSEKATSVFEDLVDAGFICTYDESSSIGKRYLRAATIGTPYCVTVDFDTLEDETVTVRDRDTEEQERIKLADLQDHLRTLLR